MCLGRHMLNMKICRYSVNSLVRKSTVNMAASEMTLRFISVTVFYELAEPKDKGAYSRVFTAYKFEKMRKVAVKHLRGTVQRNVGLEVDHQNIMKYLHIITTRR